MPSLPTLGIWASCSSFPVWLSSVSWKRDTDSAQRATGRRLPWSGVMKIMTQGMKDAKGTSFMEDYTYNLVPGKEGILEAHMLEVCPTIADGEISIKPARCPWVTGRTRPDLYSHPRQAMVSPHL